MAVRGQHLEIKMKIGILSDTHLYGVSRALEEIYGQYLSDMDLILHAGDFVSIEVVEYLNRDNFYGVHGNMDPFDIREMLPRKRMIELGAHRIGLIHGYGSPEGLEQKIGTEFPDADVIVYGHSHRAANHIREGVLFFNPGTLASNHPQRPNTIGVLEIDDRDRISGKIVSI